MILWGSLQAAALYATNQVQATISDALPLCNGMSQAQRAVKVLGIPLLENTKVTKFPVRVFDRHEIHIHDFEDCFRGSSSFSGARLHKV